MPDSGKAHVAIPRADHASISRLARKDPVITSPRMTRKSIEASVKIFLIALIITFAWTVSKVLGMLGLL